MKISDIEIGADYWEGEHPHATQVRALGIEQAKEPYGDRVMRMVKVAAVADSETGELGKGTWYARSQALRPVTDVDRRRAAHRVAVVRALHDGGLSGAQWYGSRADGGAVIEFTAADLDRLLALLNESP